MVQKYVDQIKPKSGRNMMEILQKGAEDTAEMELEYEKKQHLCEVEEKAAIRIIRGFHRCIFG